MSQNHATSPSVIFAMRINPAQRAHAEAIAVASHMNLSTFIRVAIQEAIDRFIANPANAVRQSYHQKVSNQ